MSHTSRIGLALLFVALGCEDATAPQAKFLLKAVTSTNVEGVVGSLAPVEPTVLVTDRSGMPVANVAVRFELVHAESGGTLGSIARRDALTNAEGIASAGEWTLSTTSGRNLLQVTTYGALTLWFAAQATPDAPFFLEWQAGTGDQVAFRGMTVRPPAVQVRDRFGNGVPGIAVKFAITAGGGSLEGSESVTTIDGAAAHAWTLGAGLEANTITASALELPSIEFTVQVVEPDVIYDLKLIDGAALDGYDVESGFIGLTADGHFVSQRYMNYAGERLVWTESGVYQLNGSMISFMYTSGYEEVGTLVDGVLMLARWVDETSSQQWQYDIRD